MEVPSDELTESRGVGLAIMALPAHDSLTYLAADQALCNLSSLVVFRSVWDDPDDTDFDLDKAAIRQLNILDCLIPKMNLQELIKTLKLQRDMKAATCNSRLWAEEELELSDQMVHSIYKAFGTNRFAATEDEYLEAIKNLDLMDKDDYGIKLAISRLTDRITKLQAAPCDVSPQSCSFSRVLIAYRTLQMG